MNAVLYRACAFLFQSWILQYCCIVEYRINMEHSNACYDYSIAYGIVLRVRREYATCSDFWV